MEVIATIVDGIVVYCSDHEVCGRQLSAPPIGGVD